MQAGLPRGWDFQKDVFQGSILREFPEKKHGINNHILVYCFLLNNFTITYVTIYLFVVLISIITIENYSVRAANLRIGTKSRNLYREKNKLKNAKLPFSRYHRSEKTKGRRDHKSKKRIFFHVSARKWANLTKCTQRNLIILPLIYIFTVYTSPTMDSITLPLRPTITCTRLLCEEDRFACRRSENEGERKLRGITENIFTRLEFNNFAFS